jgi:hypothetical protein
VKRVKYLRLAAVVVAAVLVAVVAASARTSAASAGAGKGPVASNESDIGPSPELGNGPAPVKGQFIYTVQADVPGVVARVETWASVDGSRSGAVRWIKCSMEGRIIPQCLIRTPAGKGPDSLNDRTYAGVQKLPADPAVLAAFLERHNSCNADPGHPMLSADEAAFSEIVMITGAVQVLPPRYGAILFQAAAKIPGTKVLAHLADAAGGSGIAVSMIESVPRVGHPGRNWGRIELIFTPRTYQYIGLQQFEGPSEHGPWTMIRATSLRSYRFVKTAPANYTGGAAMGATVCVSP